MMVMDYVHNTITTVTLELYLPVRKLVENLG